MKDAIKIGKNTPIISESILENITKLKENHTALTQFIDTLSSDKETLILCGMAGKFLNDPKLVKYILEKLKQEDCKLANSAVSQEWKEAEDELHKWLILNQSNQLLL